MEVYELKDELPEDMKKIGDEKLDEDQVDRDDGVTEDDGAA